MTLLVVDASNGSEMRRLPEPMSRLWLMRYIWSEGGSVPRILSIEHGKLAFVASYGVSHTLPRPGCQQDAGEESIADIPSRTRG